MRSSKKAFNVDYVRVIAQGAISHEGKGTFLREHAVGTKPMERDTLIAEASKAI